jgi:hypothetical protein
MRGEYIYLIFDDPYDHPYYIKGHVSIEEAQAELDKEECGVIIKSIAHKYGRLIKVGPNHPDCLDGLDTTFRVIGMPRKSYYPVTECCVK